MIYSEEYERLVIFHQVTLKEPDFVEYADGYEEIYDYVQKLYIEFKKWDKLTKLNISWLEAFKIYYKEVIKIKRS